MEGTELIKIIPATKAIIPKALIEATAATIKAGIKLDEQVVQARAAKEAALQLEKEKSRRKKKDEPYKRFLPKKESENDFAERDYRAHEDRRFGFLIIGDQHRFAGGAGSSGGMKERNISHQPPLDYSFCLLNTVDEIVAEQEMPQARRNWKVCKKTHDDRYLTASLRVSYNVLKNFEGFTNVLYKVLEAGPFGLGWLDMSFNSINSLDEDSLSQLTNLRIFYLHGNCLADMTEIPKLKLLPVLEHLTLHGNPIEQDEGYRCSVLYYLPNLKHLDFIGITKGDRFGAAKSGFHYEGHWAKKHNELEARAKLQKENEEMSLTARLLKEARDQVSDDDD